jgi:hypothetical protein
MQEKRKLYLQTILKKMFILLRCLNPKKIFSLRNMEGYQISTNKSEVSMPIKNERKNIEKEINYLRRKVDRFRIGEEKFTNMKEISKILDFDNS